MPGGAHRRQVLTGITPINVGPLASTDRKINIGVWSSDVDNETNNHKVDTIGIYAGNLLDFDMTGSPGTPDFGINFNTTAIENQFTAIQTKGEELFAAYNADKAVALGLISGLGTDIATVSGNLATVSGIANSAVQPDDLNTINTTLELWKRNNEELVPKFHFDLYGLADEGHPGYIDADESLDRRAALARIFGLPGNMGDPLSHTGLLAALKAEKAPLASPTFTGEPHAPTPVGEPETGSTRIATTAWVKENAPDISDQLGDIWAAIKAVCVAHEFEDVAPILVPHCGPLQYQNTKCTKCSTLSTRPVYDPINHDGAEETENVITEETCTMPNVTAITCDRCGGYLRAGSNEEALGHDFEEVETEPTCVDNGFTTITCSRCDYFRIDIDEDSATGHTMGDWEIIPASCEYPTEGIRHCENCDYHEHLTEDDDEWENAEGHDWEHHEAVDPVGDPEDDDYEPGIPEHWKCTKCPATTLEDPNA
jgi:hypothetical protein